MHGSIESQKNAGQTLRVPVEGPNASSVVP